MPPVFGRIFVVFKVEKCIHIQEANKFVHRLVAAILAVIQIMRTADKDGKDVGLQQYAADLADPNI